MPYVRLTGHYHGYYLMTYPHTSLALSTPELLRLVNHNEIRPHFPLLWGKPRPTIAETSMLTLILRTWPSYRVSCSIVHDFFQIPKVLYYPIIPLVRDFLNLLIGFFFKLSKQCALVLPTFKGVIYYRPVSVVDAYFLPLNSFSLSCVGFMKTSADRKLKGSLVSV